jgi:hypothetical protein
MPPRHCDWVSQDLLSCNWSLFFRFLWCLSLKSWLAIHSCRQPAAPKTWALFQLWDGCSVSEMTLRQWNLLSLGKWGHQLLSFTSWAPRLFETSQFICIKFSLSIPTSSDCLSPQHYSEVSQESLVCDCSLFLSPPSTSVSKDRSSYKITPRHSSPSYGEPNLSLWEVTVQLNPPLNLRLSGDVGLSYS